MREIFSMYRPLSGSGATIDWKATPLRASGATVVFTSTLYPKPALSPLISTLASFWEDLQIDAAFFDKSPSISPWAQPRVLKVPKLPYPAFQAQPIGRVSSSSLDSYPLIPDSKEEEKPMVDYAQTEGHIGTLRQGRDGLVYLQASSSSFIPVILPHEREKRPGFIEIEELGNTFMFSLEGPSSVQPAGCPEIEEIVFFSVTSPELTELRAKYLQPRSRRFTLTLAVKRSPQMRKELFRINVSCYAA